jgi:cyanophycinase-like exopeptidase
MTRTGTNIGYGIDEPACVICEDGKFARVLGRSVFKIEMTDFDQQVHRITRL